MTTRIASPVVTVQLEQAGTDELLEYEVQTDNRDAVQWDLLRGRKGWPPAQEAPFLWLTVLSWHALRRSGAITSSVDEFLAVCVSAKAAKTEPADPTQPAVAPAS